jgi:hypothetical protein
LVYTKNTWADRVVQNPLTYTLRNNADGTVTLIPAEGTIVQTGTPINAAVMNNLEKQYDEALLWAKSFGLGDLAQSISSTDLNNLDATGFYRGNNLTNSPLAISSSTNLFIINLKHSAVYKTQLAFYYGSGSSGSGQQWRRQCNNGVWSAWDETESTAGAQAKADAAQTGAINFAKGFGLGEVAIDVSNTDINTLDVTGFYRGSTLTNSPNVSNSYFVINIKISSTSKTQMAIRSNSSVNVEVWQRTYLNGTWTAWVQLETTAGAQTKVDTHNAATTGIHGATSAATANKLVIRDANGRAKVAAPSADDDIALLSTVKTLIANLVASSPAALDTLNELAAALGNDPNFATTMTNALAAKETPNGAQAKVNATQVFKLTQDNGQALATGAADANTLTSTGVYAGSLSANAPENDTAAITTLYVSVLAGTVTQIAIRRYDNSMFVRTANSGTWLAWKKIATTDQEAWTNLTLVNSWVSYGGVYATPGYRKNNFGEVELRGMIKSGVTTSGTVIATLPVGYRPSFDSAYPVISNNGSDLLGHVNVRTTGDITFFSGGNTWLSLDCIPPIPTT